MGLLPVAGGDSRPLDGRLVLDVSNVNPIDEATVRASGCSVLIAKATEGSGYDDKTLAQHRQIARKVGIPFGSYLFLHAASAGDEAKTYLQWARPGRGELVIIDSEPGGYDGHSVADMAKRTQSCAAELERNGYDPILYASSSVWLQMQAAVPRLKRLRVWEAQYPGFWSRWMPQLAADRVRLQHGASVVMWQWTDRYQVGTRRFDASRLMVPVEKLVGV